MGGEKEQLEDTQRDAVLGETDAMKNGGEGSVREKAAQGSVINAARQASVEAGGCLGSVYGGSGRGWDSWREGEKESRGKVGRVGAHAIGSPPGKGATMKEAEEVGACSAKGCLRRRWGVNTTGLT